MQGSFHTLAGTVPDGRSTHSGRLGTLQDVDTCALPWIDSAVQGFSFHVPRNSSHAEAFALNENQPTGERRRIVNVFV